MYSQETINIALDADNQRGKLHRAIMEVDTMGHLVEPDRDEEIENEVNDMLYEDSLADYKTAYKPWMQ